MRFYSLPIGAEFYTHKSRGAGINSDKLMVSAHATEHLTCIERILTGVR